MVITFDTETTGLDPRVDRLVLVGFEVDERALILRHDADRERIQRVLDLDARFCAHNIVFDMAFLGHAGYRTPDPARWVDTTLIAHVAGERKPGQSALRALTKHLIDLDELPAEALDPEDAINAWLRGARRQARKDGRRRPEKGDAPRDLLDPYLRADIAATRAVARHYGARAREQQQILRLEHELLPVVYQAERRGVPIDLDLAVELRDSTHANVEQLRARMFELAGRAFNVNSARQIEQTLTDRGADLADIPRTPKAGLPMFTAQTLALIDDPLARELEAYRDEKALRDYVDNLYEHTHGDRLYGHFKQAGTETGRMSSSGPNLQNIPKSDLRVRYVIKAAPGNVLVAADLDSVELRVLACYARGGALERAFADGIDLHEQTAQACGVDRDVGKRLNYLIVYGGGAPRLAQVLDIPIEQASEILNRWYATYPEVGALKARLARTVQRRGYLVTIAGRRHYFETVNHMLLNRVVSGSCADLFKRSLIGLHQAGVPMILFVHDEVVAEVDEHDAELAAALLERELTRGMSRPRVAVDGLVAEAKVVHRWSELNDPDWVPERMPAPTPAVEPECQPEQLLLDGEAT